MQSLDRRLGAVPVMVKSRGCHQRHKTRWVQQPHARALFCKLHKGALCVCWKAIIPDMACCMTYSAACLHLQHLLHSLLQSSYSSGQPRWDQLPHILRQASTQTVSLHSS